jgi:hypothetical protein
VRELVQNSLGSNLCHPTVAAVPLKYNRAGVHSHKCLELDPLKELTKKLATPNSPSTVAG